MDSMTLCKDCGWMGMQGDCIKVYENMFGTEGGVEPILQCPKCGSVVEEKEKFCKECGIPVQDLTRDYRRKLEKKGGEESG